jgi:hypothetical protein
MMKQISMRILLSSVVFLSLMLLGCNSATSTVTTPTPIKSTTSTTVQAEVDRPKLSSEEASSLIFSGLSSRLPAGYKLEQFDTNTKKVLYAGKGKWEFNINGAGKEVSELPEDIVKKSEILWVYVKQEYVTTYDLSLAADYFENTGVYEMKNVKKTNVKSVTNNVSERAVEARLEVKLYKLQYFGNRLQVQVTLENTGYVPLNGISMKTSYDKPVREIASKNYDGTLYPEQTTVLLNTYEDENILNFSYPDHLAFFTKLNTEIPFIIDTNAYES